MQPRGATPCPRSGAEAGRTPCPKSSGQEELPHIRGQGQLPRVPDCDGAGTAERSYPASKVGGRGGGRERYPASEVRGGDERSYPRPPSLEARGSGREELPHARGQGQWPRVPDCDSVGMDERSYPASEVGVVAEGRYPASEVRGGS